MILQSETYYYSMTKKEVTFESYINYMPEQLWQPTLYCTEFPQKKLYLNVIGVLQGHQISNYSMQSLPKLLQTLLKHFWLLALAVVVNFWFALQYVEHISPIHLILHESPEKVVQWR